MKDGYRLRLWGSWFALILTTGLLYFRITLNSDSLFLEDLATDLFAHGGAWSDWRLTPAPAYVPDMLLYFLGYTILPTAPLRIFFVTACQSFILVALILWLARKIYPQLSGNAKIVIILTVALTVLVAARSGMWLFFNTTNNHFSALLFSLLSLGLILSYFERPRPLIVLLIIVAGGVAKASTAIFLISFALPALVACLLVMWFIHNQIDATQYKVRLISVIAAIIGSQFLAIIINWILTYHDPMAGRAPATADAATNSFKLFIQATQGAFSPDNRSTFVFSLVVVAAFLFLTYRLIRLVKPHSDSKLVKITGVQFGFPMTALGKIDWRFSVSAFLLIIILPINILGAILSGGFADINGYRYFMFPIVLGLLLSIILIDKGIAGKSGWSNSFIYFMIFALLIGSFSTLIKTNAFSKISQNREQLHTNKYPNNKIIDCLNDMDRNGVSLDAGIADYWYARGVSQLMPLKNLITATTNDLTPFFWMSTIGPMARPENYSKRRYNFAILRNETHGGQFDFTPKTIGKLLPVDHSVYFCPGTDVQVWRYDNDQLDSVVKAAQSKLLFQEKMSDKAIFLANKLPGVVGSILKTDRIAYASDPAGFLVYGPYIDLQGGDYKISLHYKAKLNSNDTVGTFEIGRFDVPEKTIVLYKANLKQSESDILEAIVKIPAEGLQRVEFRTWFAGRARLTVKSVVLERME
jgi:hypothetical protein